jgi:Arc/MetJ-type ribon-helix-helix transcriptional regulator
MNVEFDESDLQRFIAEQVRTGRFPSPAAVVKDAVRRAMDAGVTELTDEDVAAIQLSDEQFAQGEGISAEVVKSRLRQLYGKARQ